MANKSANGFPPFTVESSGQYVAAPATGKTVEDKLFDPFGLGGSFADDSTASPRPPPELMRLTRSTDGIAPPTTSPKSMPLKLSPPRKESSVLPPKVLVRLNYHEEVSSMAIRGSTNVGASEVSVEGKLKAQIQSSDARKNVPFLLVANSLRGGKLDFHPNEEFVSPSSSLLRPPVPSQAIYVVKIPKSEIGSVFLGQYTLTEEIPHMPVLVERKLSIKGKSCRVAVQVRSKLTNMGDLTDFTIAVAIPESIVADTVTIVRGDGDWDELKRTVKWKLAHLPKGESFMVSAKCELWSPVRPEDRSSVRFPVLLRCSAADDQISTVEFRATEADGYPAAVAFTKLHSFRLLHRVT